MFKKAILLSGLCLSCSCFVSAGISSGARTITSMGCHKHDNICFIQIDGAPIGPSSCNGNSIRWDVKNEKNGTAALTLLTAAYFSNKKVSLDIDTTCFVYQNSFPTFNWFNVHN